MKQVQEALRKNAKPPITFLQALRVDLARLLLDLHAAQRDLILLRYRISPSIVGGRLVCELTARIGWDLVSTR